jgi:hypothetical protein
MGFANSIKSILRSFFCQNLLSKRKNFLVLPVIFGFCASFLNLNAFADDLYPLFLPQDFLNQSKEKHKKDHLWLSEQNPEKVREEIEKTFYFFADFTSETKNDLPRGWIDGKKSPRKALDMGYPEPYLRKPNVFHYPFYPLPQLSYFKGEDESISQINLCQSFWVQSRNQEAYTCFAQLQYNLEKGVYKNTPELRLQINMLQSFFLLSLVLNNDNKVRNVNISVDPIEYIRFKPGEMLALTKSLISYIANKYSKDFYLPKEKSKDILDNYSNFFNYPAFLNKSKFSFDNPYNMSLNHQAVDVLSWIRTTMPLIYMNAIAFNQDEKNWLRAVPIMDKLDRYFSYFEFPDPKKGSAIYFAKTPTVEQDIFFKPLNNTDYMMMTDVFRSHTLQKFNEADAALKYLAKGILRKGDSHLSSLLFKLSGDAYFDLNILQLARRSYSWSEMITTNFDYIMPSALFYGAESAFWLGQYDVAKRSFGKFLIASSDKDYLPKARLRLGNISQIMGDYKTAQSYFETIVRGTPKHPAAQDAQVNLFCMNLPQMTPKVKALEYNKIKKFITEARYDLRRQAKACMMDSDLKDATASSFSKENKKNSIENAQVQKEIIDNYKKEFPDNEFMSLFSDRMRLLELPEASWIALQNKCTELIDYYEKNKSELKYLEKNNNKYSQGTQWGNLERKKLLRCSAFVRNHKIWKEARKFDVGSDGSPLQDFYYVFVSNPSSKAAFNLYVQLKNSVKKWDTKLKKVENSGAELIERKDFWEFLAIREFLTYDLTVKEASKVLLRQTIVKDLLKEPKTIFELPLFCHWVLTDFNRLSAENLDEISKIKASNDWINLNENSQVPKKSCELVMAQNMLTQSFLLPSKQRDQTIVLPYLRKKGYEAASEDWLSLAQRLEKEHGVQDTQVVEIYDNLSKIQSNKLIQTTASLWLKKNFPKNDDKVLW